MRFHHVDVAERGHLLAQLVPFVHAPRGFHDQVRDRQLGALARGLVDEKPRWRRAIGELKLCLFPAEEVVDFLLDLVAHYFLDLFLRKEAQRDHARAERFANFGLARQCLCDLIVGGDAAADEDLAEQQRLLVAMREVFDLPGFEENVAFGTAANKDAQRSSLLVHRQVLENVGEAETLNASLKTHAVWPYPVAAACRRFDEQSCIR